VWLVLGLLAANSNVVIVLSPNLKWSSVEDEQLLHRA
jgi:hypothetical protein